MAKVLLAIYITAWTVWIGTRVGIPGSADPLDGRAPLLMLFMLGVQAALGYWAGRKDWNGG